MSFLENNTSYALHSLDIKMKNYLNYEGGFFIECGANDGVSQSNTKIFEDLMGWKGILIEASPSAYEKCVINRPNSKVYNCCLVSDDSINQIEGDFDGGLMSSIGGTRLNSNNLITVNCRTLSSILEENGVDKVDFFSLDVEGYEYQVLLGLDFNRWSPEYILVEILSVNFNSIYELLSKNGYTLIDNENGHGISNFNKIDNPGWDGTHNDYLFYKKK